MATRFERVVLELEDRFTNPTLRAAAAAGTLDKALDDVDTSSTRVHKSTKPLGDPNGPIGSTGRQSNTAAREVDRMSGRLRLLADAAVLIGPALVPIGAVAVPAVTALASQFGAAALGAGTALVAFQGVGDTLEAVNKAALEPTAENVEAAQIAMQNLAPEARRFVSQLQEMRPAFDALQEAAARGLFPGLSRALEDASGSFDEVEHILFRIGRAAGNLGDDLADALQSTRGQEFLAFIDAEVPAALTRLGHTVGNLAAGLGELWKAFTPLNHDVTGWLLNASRAFDDWARGLSRTQGFADFIAYLRENGPRVADALASIGNAFLAIVEAAALLGGPTLQALTAIADLVSAIAGSDFGPTLFAMASGMVLVSRSLKAIEAVKGSTLFSAMTTSADGASKSMSRLGRATSAAAAAFAAFAIVDSVQGGLKDFSIGVDTMTLSLLNLDSVARTNGQITKGNLEGLADSVDRLTNPNAAEALQDKISGVLGGIGNEEEFDKATAQVEALDAALAGLVSQGKAQVARSALGDLGLSESQMQDLLKLLPRYRDALAGAEAQSRLTGQAGEEGGRKAADGFKRAKSAAEQFRASVERANRVLEGRSSIRDYEAAIDDLRKSVKENGKALDVNTAKGRANQEALDNIARTTVQVAQNMKGTNRVEFLRQARKDFVESASLLGIGKERARELWAQLTQLDKVRANPIIEVNTARAEGNVRDLLGWMAQIRDRTVTVTTVFTQSGKRFKDFDRGGYTGPGHRLEPRGVVHAGEVVIPQDLVQRDWDMLRSRYGHLPGFVDGGMVRERSHASAPSASPAAGTRVVERVIIRDLAGEVTISVPGMPKMVGTVSRAEIDADREYHRILNGDPR